MIQKKSIRDIPKKELSQKKVLVRVDFNVPQDEDSNITDDSRIRGALPTINLLREAKAKIILISHLGRPKGKVKDELRLTPIAKRLSELIGQTVKKVDDCIGEEVEKAIEGLNEGEVALLENVRFYKEETDNDEQFSKKLANLAEIYVNDAFGTAHRAHASTVGVAEFLPAYAGLLIEKELVVMGQTLDNPKRPFLAIIGGAKVSTKIGVLKNLLSKVDSLIIAGGMAYTFYKAQGYEIGKSLLEEEGLDLAKAFLAQVQSSKKTVLFPVDVIIADNFRNDAQTKTVNYKEIQPGWQGLDIGPESIKLFQEEIKKAKTIVWNGPVGVFEMDIFAKGTKLLAQSIAQSEAISIIGGGDSAAAIEKFGLSEKMTHISTGGGASLEFMEGKELPGIKVLQDKVLTKAS